MATMKRVITDFDREHNPYLMKFIEAQGGRDIFLGSPKFIGQMEAALKSTEGMQSFMNRFDARRILIKDYSFAVPDFQALQLIKSHSPGGVCEIVAGTGYWASLLEKIDVEVRAYDTLEGIKDHGFRKVWTTIIPAKHFEALAIPQNSARTLFLCWPSLHDEWPTEALELYGGSKVAVIGEGLGGCTASDTFWELLEDSWDEIDGWNIPQWWGIHDSLTIYGRKGR